MKAKRCLTCGLARLNRHRELCVGISLALAIALQVALVSSAAESLQYGHLISKTSNPNALSWSLLDHPDSEGYMVVRRPFRLGALYALIRKDLSNMRDDRTARLITSLEPYNRISNNYWLSSHPSHGQIGCIRSWVPQQTLARSEQAALSKRIRGQSGEYIEVMLIGWPMRSVYLTGHSSIEDALTAKNFTTEGAFKSLGFAARATADRPSLLIGKAPMNVLPVGMAVNAAATTVAILPVCLIITITISGVHVLRERCPNCGYPAHPKRVCPECGLPG